MKSYAVVFVVQAETIEDADDQARAYLKLASQAGNVSGQGSIVRPSFEVLSENFTGIGSAPHLPTVPCKGCGKRLIDDGWVRFCSEECDDGSR